jgi:hypothetical protein
LFPQPMASDARTAVEARIAEKNIIKVSFLILFPS